MAEAEFGAQMSVSDKKWEGLQNSEVRVTDDKMEAWLYLQNPGEGIYYTKAELLGYLKDNRVTAGINTSHIAAMAKKGIYDREIKVASGKAAEESKNAWYEWFVTPPDTKIIPKVREDGSVDYTSMKALENIREGDFIAKYHPPVKGGDGYSVDGATVPAANPRPLPPLVGAAVKPHPDNQFVYIAVQSGKLQFQDNKVDIRPVHEIMGDVDYITGKVEFPGDIVINGNVGSSVVIRAERNVTVEGCVEAAEIYAEGDIILKRGVQGGKRAKIHAKQNVYADFIEHADVTAGVNVESNIILNSSIRAGNKVLTTGNHGRILGGYVHALCGIEIQEAGNDIGRKTVLHAGYEAEVYEKYLDAMQRAKALSEKIVLVAEEMKELIDYKQKRRLPLDLASDGHYQMLERDRKNKIAQLNKVKEQIAEAKAVMEKAKGASIVIAGAIYSGVHIGIHTSAFPIQKNNSFMRYKDVRGSIVSEVIVL